MSLKKILIFIDWYVPSYKAGGPISSVRNICHALQKDYEIFVVTSDKDLGDEKPLANITTNKWTSLDGVQVKYLSTEKQTKQNYLEIYHEIKPDFVHLNSLFSKFFTLLPLNTLKQFDAKIIVSPRGMLGPESLKIKPIKKKLFFVMTKVTGLFKSVIWHASSEIEAAQVQKYFGKKAIIDIAPNFSYLPQKNDSYLPKSTGEINLICVGRIAPIKNIDFLLEVLQEIKGKVNCIIVGPAEDKLYYDLCKQLVSKLKNNVTIQFIEGVNHSELDNLHKASHLFISPTKNENYGHSIVEALGHGCPVVISDKTPWSHLEEKQVGKDLPLDKQQFVSTLQSFVEMDNDTYSNFRVKARLYSEEIFSSGDTKTQYKKLYS